MIRAYDSSVEFNLCPTGQFSLLAYRTTMTAVSTSGGGVPVAVSIACTVSVAATEIKGETITVVPGSCSPGI